MLPKISKTVISTTPNSETAEQFAHWAQTAEYDKVVKAYASCHDDPHIDDSLLGLWVSLIGITLVCFCAIGMICFILGSMKGAVRWNPIGIVI